MNLKGRFMKKEECQSRTAPIAGIALALGIAAVAGWTLAVWGINEYKERTETILELQSNNQSLQEQIDKISTVTDRYGNFLETDNWEVKFAFTDGVSVVKAETGNKYDGSLHITSVTKDGKTYDITSCGEENLEKFNDENRFYLGEIVRYSNTEHDENSKAPDDEENSAYSELMQSTRYTYYTNSNTIAGCDGKEGYEIGRGIVNDIFQTIQLKD